MKKINLSITIIILLIINHFCFSIDKVFLKYTQTKRQDAIRYASDFWHRINDDNGLKLFKNFGGQFIDPVTNKIYKDCYSYGLHPSTISGMCKGDCANFVSQCLIVGGGFNDSDFTRTVSDKSHLGFSQPAITIAHAGTLKDHLINLGAYNNNSATVPNEGGGTRVLTIEDLQPGDVAIVPGIGGSSGFHALLINNGGINESAVGVWGHSPTSQARSADIKRKGFLASFSNPYTIIHIPDVPCIWTVSIYKKDEEGQHTFYYDARLDETKNGGDGEIVIEKNEEIDTDDLYSGELKLSIIFDRSIKISHSHHRIRLVKYREEVTASGSKEVEDASIVLELEKANSTKNFIYKFKAKPEDFGDRIGEWKIVADAYSNMDGTHINGKGDYSEYKDEADKNHKINIGLATKITDLWIEPGRTLFRDSSYSKDVFSEERTTNGVDYFNYINEEYVLNGLKIKVKLKFDNKKGDDSDTIDSVKKVAEKLIIRYDGKTTELNILDVKMSEYETSLDDPESVYIISFSFNDPGKDGQHKLEVMTENFADDKLSQAQGEKKYLFHTFFKDIYKPSLILNTLNVCDAKKCVTGDKRSECDQCEDKWYVYGKTIDTDPPEGSSMEGQDTIKSGIGILGYWASDTSDSLITGEGGYFAANYDGVKFANYAGIPIFYDIRVTDFQLGPYTESDFKELSRKYDQKFHFNPVTGEFQIGDVPLSYPGRISLVTTDKAGNKSTSKTANWGDENKYYDPKNVDDMFIRHNELDIYPDSVNPDKTTYIDWLKDKKNDPVGLSVRIDDRKPKIGKISFSKMLNPLSVSSFNNNTLNVDWSDPDDTSKSSIFGLDLDKSSVGANFFGVIPGKKTLTGFSYDFKVFDDKKFREWPYTITSIAFDKAGAMDLKKQIILLNKGHAKATPASIKAKVPSLLFKIDDGTKGTPFSEIMIRTAEIIKVDNGAEIIKETGLINPINLKCTSEGPKYNYEPNITAYLNRNDLKKTDSNSSSLYASYTRNSFRMNNILGKTSLFYYNNDDSRSLSLTDEESGREQINRSGLISFNTFSGELEYKFSADSGKQIELLLEITDCVCNKTTYRFKVTIPSSESVNEEPCTSTNCLNNYITVKEVTESNSITGDITDVSRGIGTLQTVRSHFWEKDDKWSTPTFGQVLIYYKNAIYDDVNHKYVFNIYNLDYSRTQFYINDKVDYDSLDTYSNDPSYYSQLGSYLSNTLVNNLIVHDRLNLQAKANLMSSRLSVISLWSGFIAVEGENISIIFAALPLIAKQLSDNSSVYYGDITTIPTEFYPRIKEMTFVDYSVAGIETGSHKIYASDFDSVEEDASTASIIRTYQMAVRQIMYGWYTPDYIIFNPVHPLPEGTNYTKAVIYDYFNNRAELFNKINVIYTPEIEYFRYNDFKSASSERNCISTLIKDYGNNVELNGILLTIDNIKIPVNEIQFDWNKNDYQGTMKYFLLQHFADGEHKATIEVTDQNGNKDISEIVFNISSPNLKIAIADKNYQDIEGNADSVINEGERIYLYINLKNIGDLSADEVQAELISNSRYIKGVPEPNAEYGNIALKQSISNVKPYEFVVENNIFNKIDIEKVDADFTLQVECKIKIDEKDIIKKFDIPFTVPIEKMDPALADFRIWLNSSIKETLDPNYTLKGGWYINGTFIKEIKAENLSGSSVIPVEIVRDDSNQTFIGNSSLTPGENRFVVTATADNGVVRTAEVSVKLLSQVGIKLDSIADTKDPNVTVTGDAWTVNSKLEKVEIYLNGGLAGDAVLEGGGRFSLPVTLNGGENIIRAVARDDQGKSAMDEIKINMHGPLTLRWQRANWRTSETPVAACGSYEVEGDDIASIVTYVNNTPNTYEVVIDRNLKTFCTTAGLQPGSNLLRAVGTTTGGVTADAYSRIQLGGLSIILDPFTSPTVSTTQRITGSFTLDSTEPYNIIISVNTGTEVGTIEYIPIVDDITKTFYVDVSIYSNSDCNGHANTIEANIYQGFNSAYYYGGEILVLAPLCNFGIIDHDPNVCITGAGSLEGAFHINDSTYHIASITVVTTKYFPVSTVNTFSVTNWNESTGRFYLDIDVGPTGRIYAVETTIIDNYGNEYYYCNDHFCSLTSKNTQDDNRKPGERRKSSQRPEKERRIKKTEHE